MGLSPNNPPNLRLQSTTASVVDATSTMPERRRHVELHRTPWDNSRYQPRISITSVKPRKGQVSTCNAGAAASPAGVPPNRPSKPGTTHHQGNGSSPLNDATNGFSTCRIFLIISLRATRFSVKPLERAWPRVYFLCSRLTSETSLRRLIAQRPI